MKNSMKSSMSMAILVTAVLAAGAATAAFAGEGKGDRKHGDHSDARRGALRDRMRGRMKQRRADAPKFLDSLNVTDEQRRLVLDKARAAAPIVSASRDEARRIIAKAWAAAAKDPASDRKAARELVKGELKALREKTRTQIEPFAKDVVASLTPEQRKSFEEAAVQRGRTIDDAKLTKIATRMIARPMTAPFLEERLRR